MKKWIVIMFLLLAGMQSKAQSTWWKEWFQQKKTQKEYLAAQIVALQAYIKVARDGYKIAQKGLNTIGNIKDGDFNLHRDFFNSLDNVNPAIKNYVKVADMAAMQVEILNACNRDYSSLQKGNMLNSKELSYVHGVYGRLLDDCANLLDELIMVTGYGNFQMDDDERIRRIDVLYESMRGNRAFAGTFGSQAKVLAAQRQQELRETTSSKLWNGID